MAIQSAGYTAGNPLSLGRALVLSLAVHGLILGSGGSQRQSGGPQEPLQARLLPPVATLSSAAIPTSRPAASVPAVGAKASAYAKAAESAPSDKTPQPARAEAAPTAGAESMKPSEAVSAISSPQGSSANTAVPSEAGGIVGDGLDPDGVRGYRVALAREAKRFKRYPARAMEAGYAGTTELRVSLGRMGMVDEIRIAKSSGHELLDQAALVMVRQAAMRAPVPESLRGRMFAVTLPVVFDLRDDQP